MHYILIDYTLLQSKCINGYHSNENCSISYCKQKVKLNLLIPTLAIANNTYSSVHFKI